MGLPRKRQWSGACAVACLMLIASTSLPQETTSPSIDRMIETIDLLETVVLDEAVDPVRRSNALDEAIEFRERLIRAGEDDPRRASWHADQAEDLLLKRIEYPTSWTPHLLNADPACPILPPEIPLIVARGLEEAMLAASTAGTAVEALEASEERPTVEVARLAQRLRFEAEVRAPLLEAIGLVLASRIDEQAAGRALDILTRLESTHSGDAEIKPVIDRWLLLAAIESGDRSALEAVAPDLESIEEDQDRIRAMMVLKSPRAAASLAARRHQMELDENRYRRLLLSDLRERALELELGKEAGWSEERGDLWIRMLDDESGGNDRSHDPALARRLAALTERLGEDSMPLAAAWALGELELVSRETGAPSGDGRARLERMLESADEDDPAHPRALSVLGRLAMADGDRLATARALEALYLTHPDAPDADPGMVADLLEPVIDLGQPWIATSFERALRRCGEASSNSGELEERRLLRLVRLAEHLASNIRREEAVAILESIRSESPTTSARVIANRARINHEMLMAKEIDEATARKTHREIASNHRSLTVRFGSAHPGLHHAGAISSLESARTRMSTGNTDQDDVRRIQSIADDELLDDETRIQALIMRHRMRMDSRLENQTAMELAPDLIEALRINGTAGRDMLLESALTRLEEIERARERGDHAEANRIGRTDLRPFAFAFESGTPPSPRILDRLSIARILAEGGRLESALDAWNNLEEEHPGTLEVLVGRANVLWRLEKEEFLADAMRIYRSLGRGQPGILVPASTWWEAQLRQLLILEQVGRSLDRINPRIERLRLIDPELGGPRFKSEFEALHARQRQG